VKVRTTGLGKNSNLKTFKEDFAVFSDYLTSIRMDIGRKSNYVLIRDAEPEIAAKKNMI
jgi:hypothetical protein